jgi:hypothetical protein
LGPSIEAGSKDEVKSVLRDAALTWFSGEQECEDFLILEFDKGFVQ